MTKDRSVFEQVFFGNPSRAGREEKVLQYVIHRINDDADLREVLEEPYVKRNCSEVEIDQICNHPDLIHAAREHLEEVFASGELNPERHRAPGK